MTLASRQTHDRQQKHDGFASAAAIGLVTVIAAALLGLGALLTADGRRTAQEAQSAQLRQLLHAAAVDAMSRLNSTDELPATWELATPEALAATLRMNRREPIEPQVRSVEIHARIAGSAATQQIRFRKVDARWEAESITLGH